MPSITGCVTLLKSVAGQPLPELERRLGFSSGALRQGAEVWRAVKLPSIDEFECYAYTLLPTDRLETDRLYDAHKVQEQFGGIDRLKVKELARATWASRGGNSLVKVRQLVHETINYPSGTGVPQWKLGTPVEAEKLATIRPGEPWAYHCSP